jgi:hypothetical protein
MYRMSWEECDFDSYYSYHKRLALIEILPYREAGILAPIVGWASR